VVLLIPDPPNLDRILVKICSGHAVGWIFLRSRLISRDIRKIWPGGLFLENGPDGIGPKCHFWPVLGILKIPDPTSGNVKISILGDFFHFFSLFSQKKVKKMAKIP